MRFLKWISNNILFIFTIFLLAFIPLYPKIPLLDIQHTWVYIRLEDFVILSALAVWLILLFLKKVSLKTPLTIPIILFWVIGGIVTLHGVLLLFPTLSNLFSNVALLSYLRRIEYISLFFVAFASIKNKKNIVYVAVSLAIILLLVVAYGFGQKFLGFPAFLTMNEEFAKGTPMQLSQLARVPSTFGGQYDLAAYLVLVIPILVSLAFGFKNILGKISLLIISALGFVLLFMTVSRISFFALLLSLFVLLILQKRKVIIALVLGLTILLLFFSPSLLQRFQSTVTDVDVLVDARTGNAIGQVKDVPIGYFKDKEVKITTASNVPKLIATSSGTLPINYIPFASSLVIEPNASTGESLPQGTSYVNLPLSPVLKKVDVYFFQKLVTKNEIERKEITVYYGDFLIKRTKAYDLSFTTRFQGEWPSAFDAFKRNILLGTGYGSVSLAVDNDYLRALGESGLLGFLSFVSIFIIALIYIRKLLPKVDSPIAKSFATGFVAGSLGLLVNAFLIDVFEASKIAFTYWILMGVVIGALYLYKTEKIDTVKEFRKIITSPIAVVIYIVTTVAAFFYPLYVNYFVGDDFTWLRWAKDFTGNFLTYFTNSDGFFYRPGTKIYFSLMYSAFWFNQTMYHLISILLHTLVCVLLFLILRKTLKDYLLSIVCVMLFMILSIHHEDIFWIASVGFLFNALFALIGLLSFIYYREKGKIFYFIISLLSIISGMLFHELGVVIPFLIILYDLIFHEKALIGQLSKKASSVILLIPIIPYLGLRFLSNSHWLSGDYNYNLLKLPYNVLGNIVGYLILDLLGPQSLSFYESLRTFFRMHILAAVLFSLIAIILIIGACYKFARRVDKKDKRIIAFGFWFFVIALLPFLGLGNIASRYSYLSSIGFVILLGFLLRKIYLYLASISDKYTTAGCMSLIVIIFIMVQTFSLQKIYNDWSAAGNKTQNFLISVEEHSKNNWLRDKMQFYFVNPPIKDGQAWVWPVGLEDALWLMFKNPNLSVCTAPDLDSAFDSAGNSSSAHVFKFDSFGNVSEFIRTKKGQIIPLNPPE